MARRSTEMDIIILSDNVMMEVMLGENYTKRTSYIRGIWGQFKCQRKLTP